MSHYAQDLIPSAHFLMNGHRDPVPLHQTPIGGAAPRYRTGTPEKKAPAAQVRDTPL